MKNIVGSPVEGENFFGRQKELDYVWTKIAAGNNMLLPAPRRVGKTSFAKKLLATAKEYDWNTLELNFEEVRTEEDFVKNFIQNLENQKWWLKAKKETKELLASIKEISVNTGVGDVKMNFEHKKGEVYQKLKKLLNHDKETLVVVDEVTVLLDEIVKSSPNGKADMEAFLHWLRSFRQVSDSKIRWVYCSSVGLENFTHLHGVSKTINDFFNYHLMAFTQEEALQLLKLLASDEVIKLDDDDKKYMLQKIGWNLPYYIQAIFKEYAEQINLHDCPTGRETVDNAYSALLKSDKFNTWIERLGEYGNMQFIAKHVLMQLCKSPDGFTREQLINSVLPKTNNDIDLALDSTAIIIRMLMSDGYLFLNGDKYIFRSPLLKDFWYNRFVI